MPLLLPIGAAIPASLAFSACPAWYLSPGARNRPGGGLTVGIVLPTLARGRRRLAPR
ncbi:hypothetical protein [uncultured Thiodictyon sp.]|jgi:hypothetical protein|uniref:hypothetical protein n=1 Tax=uncultured Thiodictyon sp. TaxID=1846217 RepID=UPI0025CE81D8|nr:hypothetical protein [uncultured Thiodictyon sp.]